jgi:serine/threonine protein kinase/tetratricopeptide (TPR) repeat protein
LSESKPDIEELFHAARALRDTAARAAFIEQATRGDTSLRRRLEALLAADVRTGDGFLEPRAAAPLMATAGHVAAAPGEQAGDTIGRYKLLQEIGEGGMGTVWMAEQREPVVRKVALKIIKLGMDTREVIVRFEAERQALALMEHPNIAKVLDGGATLTGRPYFVMELVKGVPITEYCDSAKLGLRERLELFTRVCEAIQHAHHKGVIHRDIKPSNVLVTLHDGVPVPKVIDFGIAKATSAELTKKTLFTQYAQILGTPEYMAPEQAEMSGLDIDTRADVYSLGVLLYELLTGTKPFDIKTALAAGFDELLRTIREVDPAKPSTRVSTLAQSASPIAQERHVNVESWSRRLRGDLDWIVMKALEKDRGRRYDSPSNFAADIARYLRDESVEAAPPSAVYRLRKLVRRRKKTVVAALVLMLSLVGGIVGTSWGLVRALDEKERADLATRNEEAAKEEALASAELAQREAQRAEEEAARAAEEAERARTAELQATERAAELELVAQFQAAQITRVDPRAMGRALRADLLEALPEGERTGVEAALAPVNFTNLALAALDANVLQPTLAAVDEQFTGTPLVQARLLLSLAQTMRLLGLQKGAIDPIERAFELTSAQLGPDHPNTLTVLMSYAEVCYEDGRFTDAEKLYAIAFERRLAVLGADDPLTWASQYALAKVWSELGRFEDSERAQRESLAETTRLLGPDHRDVLVGTGALCALLNETGRVAEAEAQMRDLLERYRRISGEQSPDYFSAALSYSAIVTDVDDVEVAEKYARVALAGFRELYGDEHASTLDALSSLGVALQMGERYEECVPILTEVHTKRMRVLGADHPSTLLSALNLGSVLREVGRFDEAGVHLRDAYDGLRLIFGAEHPDALVAANRIGGLRVAQGRVEEGVELLKVSIEASRRVFGDGATETTSTLNQLGYALWMLERPAEAVPYLELSHVGTQRAFGDDHPNTALVAANLGVNLCECGRAAEGVVYLQAAWNVFEADPSMLWIANTLMKNLIALERRDDALSVAHSALEKVRTLIADDELQLSNALENFGNDFLGLDDVVGAENVLRECVELRERLQPDAWRTFMARSMLGEALLRQGRFADAEPHLLAGQAGLATLAERAATLPPEAAMQLAASGARVVGLYEAWHAAEPDAGHDVSAEEWRAKLGP